MLVLLPPSERKAAPGRSGAPLDVTTLSFPSLTRHRERVLEALVRVSRGPTTKALAALGLTVGLRDELARNAELFDAPARRVSTLYTGVLYEALDVGSLSPASKRRADRQLVVASALFGALRLTDRVPAYRLSVAATLPRIGGLAASWRRPLATAMPDAARDGLVLDLRSSSYATMWQPDAELATRTVTVRVLHERVPGDPSTRAVVSHFNKATKGRVVRELLESASTPATADDLADALAGAGRVVEVHPPRRGKPRAMDVVVGQL